jgi:hypothetical protein
MEEKTMSSDYDVVLHTLQEKRDELWKMTEQNMSSEYIGMGIMDDIRLSQIRQLDIAMKMWKERLENINERVRTRLLASD